MEKPNQESDQEPAKQRPIHERVQEVVTAANLTNADLAKLTGWHELRVWRKLTGRTELTAADVELLAEVLEKSVAELYGESAA